MTTECLTSVYTHIPIFIHIIGAVTILTGKSRWVRYILLLYFILIEDALSILTELLLNVCTTIIKLYIILACVITTCIDLFIKILVASGIYVIQFSSGAVHILVQELQDLFTLAKAILILIQQMISSHYCSKGYSILCKHS